MAWILDEIIFAALFLVAGYVLAFFVGFFSSPGLPWNRGKGSYWRILAMEWRYLWTGRR